MVAAVDWSLVLTDVYNATIVLGALGGLVGGSFTIHRRHVERRQHDADTRDMVENLHTIVKDHGEALSRIEKKLVPNGRNTQNPGDLLALICDRLGIQLP